RPDDAALSELNIDVLFDDPWVLAARADNPWTRRRKLDLAELLEEPWLMPPPDTSAYKVVAGAFEARRLAMPRGTLVTYSMELRAELSSRGRFITVLPKSLLRQDNGRRALKQLAVDIPMQPWPVAILTVKDRTLHPVVGRFIECARE